MATLLFLILSIFVFLFVVVTGHHMTEPNEALRWMAGGLALFAAAHIGWPANWGPGPRS